MRFSKSAFLEPIRLTQLIQAPDNFTDVSRLAQPGILFGENISSPEFAEPEETLERVPWKPETLDMCFEAARHLNDISVSDLWSMVSVRLDLQVQQISVGTLEEGL